MRSQESYLSDRLLLAFALLEATNWLFLFLGRFISNFIGADFVLSFALRFIIRTIQFLFIVLKIYKLPNGHRTLKEYLYDIKLLVYKPVSKSIVIAFYSTLILLGGLFLAALFHGNCIIDLSVINPANSSILFVAINAGIWEEIMWRGIIVTLLLKKYNVQSTIVINSILFALSHLINLLVGQSFIVIIGQIIFVLIGTPILAYVFIKTESLLPGILIHFLVDAFSPIFINTMIQPGPDILIGGIYMLVGWAIGNIVALVAVHWHIGNSINIITTCARAPQP